MSTALQAFTTALTAYTNAGKTPAGQYLPQRLSHMWAQAQHELRAAPQAEWQTIAEAWAQKFEQFGAMTEADAVTVAMELSQPQTIPPPNKPTPQSAEDHYYTPYAMAPVIDLVKFVASVRGRGIHLESVGGQIRAWPAALLSADTRKVIRENRLALLQVLDDAEVI